MVYQMNVHFSTIHELELGKSSSFSCFFPELSIQYTLPTKHSVPCDNIHTEELENACVWNESIFKSIGKANFVLQRQAEKKQFRDQKRSRFMHKMSFNLHLMPCIESFEERKTFLWLFRTMRKHFDEKKKPRALSK